MSLFIGIWNGMIGAVMAEPKGALLMAAAAIGGFLLARFTHPRGRRQ
jgi:hypothetical protein